MPLPDDARLISIDDHVIEPPSLWESRLPRRHLNVGPRFLEIEGSFVDPVGHEVSGLRNVWQYEDRIYLNFALNAVAGNDPATFGTEPQRWDEIRPGCYDPNARADDMDLDGIQAGLCFPTFPRLAGTLFLEANDKELALLCVKAWNDFILEEWCAAQPERLIPMAILPLWDVDLCVQEVQRTAAMGVKAISFPETPSRLGLHSFHDRGWNPLFAAVQDSDLALCLHFGSSGLIPTTSDDAPDALWIATMGTNSMIAAADLAYSPVFHEFPQLRVALSEGGIGWIPYLLDRIDQVWERHGLWTGLNQEKRPSELVREHVWGCFIDDRTGIAAREVIGVDRICWECDYPHSDSNWPNSRALAEKALADVSDHDARRIVELNARELLRFDFDLAG